MISESVADYAGVGDCVVTPLYPPNDEKSALLIENSVPVELDSKFAPPTAVSGQLKDYGYGVCM